MIAKIKLDDREYFSYIFFICKCEYQTKVIVYNEEENKFEFIDVFKNKYTSERVVYLFDFKEEDLISKKQIQLHSSILDDCMGYSWLIENIDLLNDIEAGISVDAKYLEIAKGLNSTIDVYRWHEVESKEDIDELMDISGAFHDSYIRDIKGIFGRPYEPEFETKFQVAFEMYGNSFDLMMEFDGGVEINYYLYENLNGIYLSTILMHEGRFYWIDGGDELSPIDIKDNPYISSGRLRWKIIDKKEK